MLNMPVGSSCAALWGMLHVLAYNQQAEDPNGQEEKWYILGFFQVNEWMVLMYLKGQKRHSPHILPVEHGFVSQFGYFLQQLERHCRKLNSKGI